MSPVASRSVLEHIARGACAVVLAGLAVRLIAVPTFLRGAGAVAGLAGVVVLLRGCPMCWLIGLFETIAHSSRKDAVHD